MPLHTTPTLFTSSFIIKFQDFPKNEFSLKFVISQIFRKFANPINLALAFALLHFITCILIFEIRLTTFSLLLHILHQAKP